MSAVPSSSSKRQKIDLSTELKPNVDVSKLKVGQIKIIFHYYNQQFFDLAESCVYHELQDNYADLQARFYTAQRYRLPSLVRIRQSHPYSDLPKPTAARKLGHLLRDLSRDPNIQDITVKDEIRYYEAVCIGVGAFSLHSLVCRSELVTWAEGSDPVQYYAQLVEASERYLNKDKPLTPITALATAPVPAPAPATAPPPPPPPPTPLAVNTKHEPFSDEYLRAKVSDFLVDRSVLQEAIPWAEISDYGSDFKDKLEASYYAVTSNRLGFRGTPQGVLLHGDQGTGKTSVVLSFAAHYDLQIYQVAGSVHGSLRGQSEKLMEYIFDAVRQAAVQKPCILFFDEVDALLGAVEGSVSSFEGVVKRCWGDIISNRVPCFVFGATNKPWNVNMGDYGRRFRLKVHITIPDDNSRAIIAKSSLSAFHHSIIDQEMKEIAAATKGCSADDVVAEIQALSRSLLLEMYRADKWMKMTIGGKDVWVPAREGDNVAKEGKHDEIGDVEYRSITKDMVVEWFSSGKASKTCSPELEQRHADWNTQWRV